MINRTEPKISIFICSYNNPGNIAVVIGTVLRQTVPDFELFLLDSSDDKITRGIIRNFTDSRIKCFEENGYSKSSLLNKYLPKAKGKYIMIFSDNDILMTNCFTVHLTAFGSNPKSRANYATIEAIYTYGNYPNYKIYAKGTYSDLQKPEGKIDLGSLMFERALLTNLPHPFFGSDLTFINHLSHLTNIYPIAQALHIKRITPNKK